jgi:hypothetical protein
MRIDSPGARVPLDQDFDDRVMYVGMNSAQHQCDREARAVHAAVVIEHGERDKAVGADHARVGDGGVVDLATDRGAVEFAQSLGLPDAQANIVANVIRHSWHGCRDELAAIARVWAQAERGGSVPSRLVLSGHCYGNSIWDGGDENLGALVFANLRALASAMPRAAAHIEDVMISACSSGFVGADATDQRDSFALWKTAFPNLKTAWAYGSAKADYHSPTSQQAIMHIQAWEHATRGRAQSLDATRALYEYFDEVRRENPGVKVGAPELAGNVSVWTTSQGYVGGKGR